MVRVGDRLISRDSALRRCSSRAWEASFRLEGTRPMLEHGDVIALSTQVASIFQRIPDAIAVVGFPLLCLWPRGPCRLLGGCAHGLGLWRVGPFLE